MTQEYSRIYKLAHWYLLEGEAEGKSIGMYSTRDKALEAYDRLKDQEGFRDHPGLTDWSLDEEPDEEAEGFHLSEHLVDGPLTWETGFFTFRYQEGSESPEA